MPILELLLILATLILGVIGTVGESLSDGKLTKFGRGNLIMICVIAVITLLSSFNAQRKETESAKEETQKYISLINQIQRTMYPLDFSDATLRFTYDLDRPCYAELCSNLVANLPEPGIKQEISSLGFKLQKLLGSASDNICGYVTETNGMTTGFISDDHGNLASVNRQWSLLDPGGTEPIDIFVHSVMNDSYTGAILDRGYASDGLSRSFAFFSNPYFDAPRSVGLFLDFGPPALRTAEANYNPLKQSLEITLCFQKLTVSSGNGKILSMFDIEGMLFALQFGSMTTEKRATCALDLPPPSVDVRVSIGRFRKIRTTLDRFAEMNTKTFISKPLSASQAGVEGLQFTGDQQKP